MTEKITPERSAALLADAIRFVGRMLHEWPPEWSPDLLAALIARGYRGERKAEYQKWRNRIHAAIKAGHLPVGTEERKEVIPGRKIPLGYTTVDGYPARVVGPVPAREVPYTVQRVARDAAALWLERIGFDFANHEHVCAWLGDALQEELADTVSPVQDGAGTAAGELATTAQVRTALALAVGEKFEKFERALGDAPGWIKKARRSRAGKSKSAGYWWNVAVLAEAITVHYHLSRKAVHAAIAVQWPTAAELFSL